MATGFEKLVADAETQNIWERLGSLQSQYQKKCPKCSKTFWVNEKLIATNWFDGHFVGYHCPEPDCDGVVDPAEEE